MTDRELLEKAAKAAGLHGEFGSLFGKEGIIVVKRPGSRLWTGKVWNPLTDDGDVFRLAVKLNLGVQSWHGSDGGYALARWSDKDDDCVAESSGDDPYAATRRAIVLAAVASLKEIPEK